MAVILGASVAAPSSPSVINVHDYGAKGDGVTDDGAALQLAINAVSNSNGRALLFPPNVSTQYYKTTIPLDFKGRSHFRVVGQGGQFDGRSTHSSGDASTIVQYVGGGTGTAFDFRDNVGLTMDGVDFRRNDGLGTVADFSSSGTPGDIVGLDLNRCHFLNGNNTVILDTVIEARFSSCFFGGGSLGTASIVGNNGNWSNALTFVNCTWETPAGKLGVLNPGIQWAFVGCTIEKRTSAMTSEWMQIATGHGVDSISFTGCGFWDVTGSSAGVAWIVCQSGATLRALLVQGCHIEMPPSGYAFDLQGTSGVCINANQFSGSGGTPSVFNSAHTITNGSWGGNAVINGAVDNHAATFV